MNSAEEDRVLHSAVQVGGAYAGAREDWRGRDERHGSARFRDGAASSEEIKFREKLKLVVVVPEEMLDRAAECIVKLARTGEVGAGKIFVIPVEDAIRIGTGEVGYAAIM